VKPEEKYAHLNLAMTPASTLEETCCWSLELKWSIVIASHTGKIVQPTKSIILGPGYKAYPENEGAVKLKKKKNEEGVVVDLFWSRIAWKSTFGPGHIIVAVNGTIPILCTDSLDCSSDADIWRRTVSHALSRTNFCAIAHTYIAPCIPASGWWPYPTLLFLPPNRTMSFFSKRSRQISIFH
jgi:hypothetical protein